MTELGKHLREEYKDKMAIINGEGYVSIDVFESAMYHLALSDAVIGALTVKYGNIEISEDDIIDYMTEYTSNVEVRFDNRKYTTRRV